MVKRKEDYHRFGNKDDSLSYVVAMNDKKKTSSKFGMFWVWLLEIIDPGHMAKAIENKILHDKEALERLKDQGLI